MMFSFEADKSTPDTRLRFDRLTVPSFVEGDRGSNQRLLTQVLTSKPLLDRPLLSVRENGSDTRPESRGTPEAYMLTYVEDFRGAITQ
jgi:hypothetical protein